MWWLSVWVQIFAEASTTIKYGENLNEGDSLELFMDVYTPQGDTASRRPVVILAHGGDFHTEAGQTRPLRTVQLTDMSRRRLTPTEANAPRDSGEVAGHIRSMQDLKAAVGTSALINRTLTCSVPMVLICWWRLWRWGDGCNTHRLLGAGDTPPIFDNLNR